MGAWLACLLWLAVLAAVAAGFWLLYRYVVAWPEPPRPDMEQKEETR